jgi:murein DD-endopeptidase MepM/ murein hydrolase activator NlpD
MKRLCVFTLALMFWSGVSLWSQDPANPFSEADAPVEVSSNTVLGEAFVWPVSAMVGNKKVKIVSKFGKRKSPGSGGGPSTTTVASPGEEMHTGIDFAIPPESNVRAACSGKVLFAGYSSEYVSRKDKKDKSHLVIVRHADGKSTRYVHMNRLKVRPGLDVKAGDILGTSSESDEWGEPVLHFEIRDSNGKPLDPMTFLSDTMRLP